MKCIRLVLVLPVVVLMMGCASTYQRVNDLEPGMSKEQVIAVLGKPDTTSAPNENVQILHFNLTKARHFWQFPLTIEYFARLTDGKLDAYGTPKGLKKLTSAGR